MNTITLIRPHYHRTSQFASQQPQTCKLHTAAPYPLLLAELCGLQSLPIAAMCAAAQDLNLKLNWLKVTPISLQLGRSAVIGSYPNEPLLTQSEAEQLASDLNTVFQHENLIFHATGHDLLLGSSLELGISTTSLQTIQGQNLLPYLPKGSRSAYWHKLFTELQMFCHQHPLNQARKDSQSTIDALWLWGEGALPATVPSSPWKQIYSDAHWLKDYAAYLHTSLQQLQAGVWPTDNSIVNDSLFVLEQLTADQQFLEFLHKLSNKPQVKIILYPGDGNCYHLLQQQTSAWQKLKAFFNYD
jgi:hypothetical protein